MTQYVRQDPYSYAKQAEAVKRDFFYQLAENLEDKAAKEVFRGLAQETEEKRVALEDIEGRIG